jgi:hypothetical protein
MDHLFISYAIEDAPLARWLTLKLTIEGYKVWCFEFEMLGGESFPKEIGDAIKTGAFRMLALVSHSSVKKSNPVKEWTLGQAIGAERKLDFVIPLNVDGVRPTELPWTMSDINWVSFYSAGWAGGFRQLLKLLEKLGAPRPIQNGAAISAHTFIPEELTTSTPELLYSNTLRFRNIPELIKGFRWKRSLKENESSEISHRWAYKRVNKDLLVSLNPPPQELADVIEETGNTWAWKSQETIEGIKSQDLLSHLLGRSVSVILLTGGCRYTEDFRSIYFDTGLFPKDKIIFTDYKNKRTRIAIRGKSTFYRRGQTQICYYHLGFRHSIAFSPSGESAVVFKIYLRIIDQSGKELEARAANTRRKAITHSWWNNKLLNRYIALCEALKQFQDLRQFREVPEQVLLEPKLVTFAAPFGLDESIFEDADEKGEDDGTVVNATIVPFDDEEEE